MDKQAKLKAFKRFAMISAVLVIILLILPTAPVYAADTDGDGLDNIDEQYYMQLYAPTLYFKAGENFFPVDPSHFVDNCILYQDTGTPPSVIDSNPSITTIDSYTTNDYFLGSAIGGYSAILANYASNRATWGYQIYGHVYPEGDFIAVQFWFFYVYNDASLNQHEGDWEMIVILLNESTEQPVSAAYSQHSDGEVAAWADVEKTNTTHPNVYVAKGSHANYFRPYQGKVGLENDEVANDGFVLPYNDPDVTFELLSELGNHPVSQDWIVYGGRWGNYTGVVDALMGFAGPYGPGHEDNSAKWITPATWALDTFSVNSTWFILCWIMYYLLYIFLGIFAIQLIIKLIRAARTRSSKEVPSLGTVLQGRAAFGVLLGGVAMLLTVIAIFFPWYSLTADIDTVIVSAEGQILSIDGWNGLQINPLIAGSGYSSLMNVAIPFYIILITGIILTFVDIIGAKKAKNIGNKFIFGGLTFLIFLIIIIILISQLGALVPYLESILGMTLPSEITTIMTTISQQPFQGATSISWGGLGTVNLAWGLMMGAFLLLGSAIVKIFAGIILRSTPERA
ncbi:MAG: Vps62-related protein [Candidatus Helarchaeota archaeon]|nr:Vps62-related protein [Candidatus Helarchaeota archaeon]